MSDGISVAEVSDPGPGGGSTNDLLAELGAEPVEEVGGEAKDPGAATAPAEPVAPASADPPAPDHRVVANIARKKFVDRRQERQAERQELERTRAELESQKQQMEWTKKVTEELAKLSGGGPKEEPEIDVLTDPKGALEQENKRLYESIADLRKEVEGLKAGDEEAAKTRQEQEAVAQIHHAKMQVLEQDSKDYEEANPGFLDSVPGSGDGVLSAWQAYYGNELVYQGYPKEFIPQLLMQKVEQFYGLSGSSQQHPFMHLEAHLHQMMQQQPQVAGAPAAQQVATAPAAQTPAAQTLAASAAAERDQVGPLTGSTVPSAPVTPEEHLAAGTDPVAHARWLFEQHPGADALDIIARMDDGFHARTQ